MNKYYWFSIAIRANIDSDLTYGEMVSDEHSHPFMVVHKYITDGLYYDVVLMNWKEITEDEYNLFRQLEKS